MKYALLAAIPLVAACREPSKRVLAELKQRSAYMRTLAQSEGFPEAWSLNSRDDVSFESGVSNVQFVNPRSAEAHWFDIAEPDLGELRGIPVRFMNRSVHIRVHGNGGPMTLGLGGTVNVNAVFTKPRLEVSLDGALLASMIVDPDGRFKATFGIAAADVAEWADLYLTWTALQDPEREAGEPRVARLEYLHWEPTR